MSFDERHLERYVRELQAIGIAQAADEELDAHALAKELDVSAVQLEMDLGQLQSYGLCLPALEGERTPLLLKAGRQFLACRGEVDHDVLVFLPRVIDDLHAREALLRAGTVLVDEFRAALLDGHGVEHAEGVVPPAFAAAVDDALALNLYSASVALLARLSYGAPAACVAEEIVAVSLIEGARFQLEMQVEEGSLDEEQAQAAAGEFTGLFELFEDDEVLNLFDMSEPADAALAGHDPINQQLGVVDQRIEAWFQPFGWATSTGYLNERRHSPGSDD